MWLCVCFQKRMVQSRSNQQLKSDGIINIDVRFLKSRIGSFRFTREMISIALFHETSRRAPLFSPSCYFVYGYSVSTSPATSWFGKVLMQRCRNIVLIVEYWISLNTRQPQSILASCKSKNGNLIVRIIIIYQSQWPCHNKRQLYISVLYFSIFPQRIFGSRDPSQS